MGRCANVGASRAFVKRVSGVLFVWIGWFPACAATTVHPYIFMFTPQHSFRGCEMVSCAAYLLMEFGCLCSLFHLVPLTRCELNNILCIVVHARGTLLCCERWPMLCHSKSRILNIKDGMGYFSFICPFSVLA